MLDGFAELSDLSFIEKSQLEKLLDMGAGYVLDFSNRTFQELITDSVQRDIYDDKYAYAGGSKANRLRAFWDVEPNHVVGKLIADLLKYRRHLALEADEQLWRTCVEVVDRLRKGAPVIDVDALCTQPGDPAFDMLARSVKQAIDGNEPESALDHLHTYVVMYMRRLCQRYGIAAPREKPLHSLVGEYVKHMRGQGRIESEMTDRILKSTISIMEAFNRVRKQRSLAHDNSILNYKESLLIFNHIASSIKFMEALERDGETRESDNSHLPGEEFPF